MTRDLVGFGECSRRHATTTRNAFVRVTTTPTDDGAEVVVECVRGMRFAAGPKRLKFLLKRDGKGGSDGQRERRA